MHTADEVRVVDRSARVAGAVEGLDHDLGGAGIVEADAQACDGACPPGHAIDRNHRARLNPRQVHLSGPTAHGHVGVGATSRRGGGEVEPTIRAKLGLLLGRPLDVAARPLQPFGPPVQAQPRSVARGHLERRALRAGFGFRQLNDPALFVHLSGLRAGDHPPLGRGAGCVVSGDARPPAVPPDAATLRPERHTPALCLSHTVVLLGVDLALRVDAATRQPRPTARASSPTPPPSRGRPEGGHGHPLIPQRDQRPGRLIVQPV